MWGRRGTARWASALASSLFLVGAAFAAYLFFWVGRQEAYYTGRNFRILESIGSELVGQRDALSQILRFNLPQRLSAKGAVRDQIKAIWFPFVGDLAARKNFEQRLGAIRRVRGFGRLDLEVKLGQQPTTACGEPDLVPRASLRGDRVEGAFYLCAQKDFGIEIKATVPLHDLLNDARAISEFDEVLIADASGVVVDRRGRVESGIHRIGDLLGDPRSDGGGDGSAHRDPLTVSVVVDGAKKKSAVAELREASSDATSGPPFATVVRNHELRGVDYTIFVQPIEHPFPEKGDIGARWYVVGLVPTSRFRADVSSVPLPVLATTVLALVLCALAWPLFRLWFSGADQEVRNYQVGLLGLSLVAFFGIFVLTALGMTTERERRIQRNETLEAIAQDLSSSFSGELRVWVERLRAQETRLPFQDPTDRVGEIRTFQWPKGAAYPPFEVAFGLDERGTQVGDIRTYRSEVSTPPLRFEAGDRDYFRRVRDGRTWSLPFRASLNSLVAPAGGPFALERIRAKDQGVLLYTLAAPASQPSAMSVVVMAGTLRALSDATLPQGYGFVVVDNAAGTVIHHQANDQLSLIENFFDESDGDQSLVAAIRAHRKATLSGRYYGRPHRFRTLPLPYTEWSVVVYHEESPAIAAHLELLIVTATHLAIYCVMLGATLAVAAWVIPAPRGWSWTWPDPGTCRSYPLMALALLALLIAGMAAIGETPADRSIWLPAALAAQTAATIACMALAFAAPSPLYRRRESLRAVLALGTVALAVFAQSGASAATSTSGAWWRVTLVAVFLVALYTRYRQHLPADVSWIARHWRTTYALSSALALAIVAGLPAVAVFRDGLRFEVSRMATSKAIRFAEALEASATVLRDEAFRVKPTRNKPFESPWSAEVLPLRLGCSGGEAWTSTDVSSTLCIPHRWERSFDDPLEWDAPAAEPTGSFTAWLATRLPAVDRRFEEVRFTDLDRAGDRSWWLEEPGDELGLRVKQGVSHRVPRIVPSFLGSQGELPMRAGLVALLLAFVPSYFLLRSAGRRLQGLGLTVVRNASPPLAPRAWIERSHFVVGPVDRKALASEVEEHAKAAARAFLDVNLAFVGEPEAALRKLRDLDAPALLVGGVDIVLADPERRQAVLKLLETAMVARQLPVCMISEISPLAAFDLPSPEKLLVDSSIFDAAAGKDLAAALDFREQQRADERVRWANLLGSVVVIDATSAPTSAWKDIQNEGRAVLERECGWHRELARIATELTANVEGLSEDQVIGNVGMRAEGVFRRIWETCTMDERLTLLHLARGSFVNTRNRAVLQALERRGLVVRDPVLRISGEAFARFARRAEGRERISQWERSVSDSTWARLRIPVAIAFTAAALFVIYTGQDVVNAGVAAIPAVIAAIPSVLALVNTARGGNRAGASSEA